MFRSRTLVIIPARGGSKGVPKKNKRLLFNQPLVTWSIRTAKRLFSPSNIVVTTDDDDISAIATKESVTVVRRGNSLSNDTAATVDVVINVLENIPNMGRKFDTVLLLEPTNPFRDIKKIKDAIKLMDEGPYSSVVSFVSVKNKPNNIFDVSTGKPKRLIKLDQNLFHQRQSLSNFKRVSGNFYLTKIDNLLKERQFIVDPMSYVEVTEEEAINIDSNIDFMIAEMYAEKFKALIK